MLLFFIFLPDFKYLASLKIKDKKLILPKLYFRQRFTEACLWTKDLNPDPGDPKRPDPDPQVNTGFKSDFGIYFLKIKRWSVAVGG